MNIVFVTNNKNKLVEIRSLISKNYNVKRLKDIDFHDEIDETEATLEGTALLKARHIYSKFGLPLIGNNSFGMTLVKGSILVPKPASGISACFII